MWPIPAGPLLLFPGPASLIGHGVLWTLSTQLGGQQPLSPGPPALARAEVGPGELPFPSTLSGPVSHTRCSGTVSHWWCVLLRRVWTDQG